MCGAFLREYLRGSNKTHASLLENLSIMYKAIHLKIEIECIQSPDVHFQKLRKKSRETGKVLRSKEEKHFKFLTL